MLAAEKWEMEMTCKSVDEADIRLCKKIRACDIRALYCVLLDLLINILRGIWRGKERCGKVGRKGRCVQLGKVDRRFQYISLIGERRASIALHSMTQARKTGCQLLTQGSVLLLAT